MFDYPYWQIIFQKLKLKWAQSDWSTNLCWPKKCKILSNPFTLAHTFNFHIDDRALTIKFLFKNHDPVQWISLELNTSSFLLSYVDRLMGCWKKERGPKRKKVLIRGYTLSLRIYTENKYILITFVATSVKQTTNFTVMHINDIHQWKESYEYLSFNRSK